MRERACEHLAPFTWLAGRSPRTSASNARHRESLVRGEAKHPAPKKRRRPTGGARAPAEKRNAQRDVMPCCKSRCGARTVTANLIANCASFCD